MVQYHKIKTMFERDPETSFKTVREGIYATREFLHLKDTRWVWTEKIDGTNMRVIWRPDVKAMHFSGKSDNSQVPTFLLRQMEGMFNIEALGACFDVPVCLYGEGFGLKIQKGGKYIRDGCSFILFDVLIDGVWLERSSVEGIARDLNIKCVPVVGEGTLSEAARVTKAGPASEVGECLSEGLVLRPAVELRTRRGERIITKIKHRDFEVGRNADTLAGQ